MKTIALGSDHGGLDLRLALANYCQSLGYTVIDLGTETTDSVDYPDFADKVVSAIRSRTADLGILVCGTGIGISIRANRYPGIRAALVHDTFTAEMTKAHNDANILCLGGRTCTEEDAKLWVKTWLETPFEGGRHQGRIDKLDRPLIDA